MKIYLNSIENVKKSGIEIGELTNILQDKRKEDK